MNLSITRRQRSLLFFLSASGYVAMCSGLGDRLEAQIITPPPLPSFTIAPERFPPRVASLITRDPFVAQPQGGDSTSRGSRNGTPSARTLALADDGPAVPNIAEDPGASGPPLTLVLKATIVGNNPVAYVENGSAMDIVRVGDLLGERRVKRIDLQGIEFDDGARLELPRIIFTTPPPSSRQPDDAVVPLADLRRLLAVPQPERASPTAGPAPQPTSPSTLTASPPTPGPMRTINQNGLPVGVNPTSDPNRSPYPYQYLYVPRR